MALLLSGCMGSTNVQDKNTAITSWNKWADAQQSFDSKATQTLTLYVDHLNTYQSVITESSPDYNILITNFGTDKNNFQNWDSYLSDLNTATTDFSGDSASLTGDSKTYADEMLTNMRTYHTEMQNAQIDYIASCDDLISYMDSAQRGSPDATMLQASNSKKDDANTAVQNAAAATNQAMDSMKRLQSS